jgi:hypothetical protein
VKSGSDTQPFVRTRGPGTVTNWMDPAVAVNSGSGGFGVPFRVGILRRARGGASLSPRRHSGRAAALFAGFSPSGA